MKEWIETIIYFWIVICLVAVLIAFLARRPAE